MYCLFLSFEWVMDCAKYWHIPIAQFHENWYMSEMKMGPLPVHMRVTNDQNSCAESLKNPSLDR
jgi:hypothetical protein